MTAQRKRIIAGNWKMNGSRAEVKALVEGLKAQFTPSANAEMVVFPPSVHVADVADMLENSHIAFGAQNAFWEPKGAFTGEISCQMLKDYGVTHLLVGHSERRELFGDSLEVVAKKFLAALEAGLVPVLCIGESLDEREQGKTLEVLKLQCQAVIDKVGIEALGKGCIAYEPIWAIGTGQTATPELAQEVHSELRGWLAQQNETVADALQILYGGSMNAANAEALLAQPDIDGGLIGGASLKVEDFMTIYSVAR